jgi:hypothetical protein
MHFSGAILDGAAIRADASVDAGELVASGVGQFGRELTYPRLLWRIQRQAALDQSTRLYVNKEQH